MLGVIHSPLLQELSSVSIQGKKFLTASFEFEVSQESLHSSITYNQDKLNNLHWDLHDLPLRGERVTRPCLLYILPKHSVQRLPSRPYCIMEEGVTAALGL